MRAVSPSSIPPTSLPTTRLAQICLHPTNISDAFVPQTSCTQIHLHLLPKPRTEPRTQWQRLPWRIQERLSPSQSRTTHPSTGSEDLQAHAILSLPRITNTPRSSLWYSLVRLRPDLQTYSPTLFPFPPPSLHHIHHPATNTHTAASTESAHAVDTTSVPIVRVTKPVERSNSFSLPLPLPSTVQDQTLQANRSRRTCHRCETLFSTLVCEACQHVRCGRCVVKRGSEVIWEEDEVVKFTSD